MNPVRTGSGDSGPRRRELPGLSRLSRVDAELGQSGDCNFAFGEIVVPRSVAASRWVLALIAGCGSLPLWLSAGARLSRVGCNRADQEFGGCLKFAAHSAGAEMLED
jgi:hypothetical protein